MWHWLNWQKNFPMSILSSWRKLVDKAFDEAGIDVRQLPNLIMDPNLDAQKLILESSVVCGINSTTILEAALAGKPVIVPYFKQLRQDLSIISSSLTRLSIWMWRRIR